MNAPRWIREVPAWATDLTESAPAPEAPRRAGTSQHVGVRRSDRAGPASWLATWGSTDSDQVHSEAEHALRVLPFRYQQYISELLLDDERLLFVLLRPSFRLRGRGARAFLAARRFPDGVLVVTDRSVLLMEDAAPYHPDRGPWGYMLQAVAVERLDWVDLEPQREQAILHLGIARAPDPLRWAFPPTVASRLHRATQLLRQFIPDGGSRALRRVYQEKERQGPAAAVARREGLNVGTLALVERAHFGVTGETPDVVRARSAHCELAVTNDGLSWAMGAEQGVVRGPEIQWLELKLTMLSTCELRLRLAGPDLPALSFKFQYPELGPFTQAVIRLRHQMGRP